MASKKVIDEGFDIAKNIANDVMNAIKGKTEDAVKAAPKKIVVAPKVVAVAKVNPAPKVKVAKSKIDLTQDTGTASPEEFRKTFKIGHPYKDTLDEENMPVKEWEDLYYSDEFNDGDLFYSKDGIPNSNDMIGLTKHIKKNGLIKPVRVDRNTMEVLDGHHRVIAASDAGKPIKYELVGKKAEVKPLEKTIADEVSDGMTAPKVEAKPVSDLVFKFEPKPGEVTGSDAIMHMGRIGRAVDPSRDAKKDLTQMNKFIKQINKGNKDKKLTPGFLGYNDYASLFNELEAYNIPREYTGKVANSLVKYFKNSGRKFDYNDSVSELKNLNQLKTKNQLETFISLLPEWNQSVEELVQTAKTL